jgi:hypothetical protein
MRIYNFLQSHWVQIGLCWLAIQNFLKAIQDSIDTMPKGLPFLSEVVYIMQGVGSYLFLGNRPTPIQPNPISTLPTKVV